MRCSPSASVFTFALLGVLALGHEAYGQTPVAIPLVDHQAYGVTIEELDAAYRSAVDADTALAVFPDRPGEVAAAWAALLGRLTAHLSAEGFEWSEPLRGFHRFYFGADGRVDRVLYHLRGEEPERLARYGELLGSFAEGARIELTAEEPFAQCSPITLMPPAE